MAWIGFGTYVRTYVDWLGVVVAMLMMTMLMTMMMIAIYADGDGLYARLSRLRRSAWQFHAATALRPYVGLSKTPEVIMPLARSLLATRAVFPSGAVDYSGPSESTQ